MEEPMVGVSPLTPADRISSRLKQIGHGRDQADVATLQFVGLEAIQHAAGALWPQRWSRIRRLSEAFIRERLAPDDILVRGPEAFIIAFAQRTGQPVRDAALNL